MMDIVIFEICLIAPAVARWGLFIGLWPLWGYLEACLAPVSLHLVSAHALHPMGCRRSNSGDYPGCLGKFVGDYLV